MLAPTTSLGAALDEVVGRLVVDPAPRGDGRTLHNWRVLAAAGADDLVVGRLAEAHLDARTISDELAGPTPPPGTRWGVWAAESSSRALHAEPTSSGRWRLTGTKPWCSGVGIATHALVTARAPDGYRLFAVDLDHDLDHVAPHPPAWAASGMAADSPRPVELRAAPGEPVGAPGAYLDRPGFWHSAAGVAAVWFGGAVGVAATLYRAGTLDAHGRAHRGAVDAALAAGRALLREAADEIDRAAVDTEDTTTAHRRALRVRACVEDVAEKTLRHTARATGPGPLAGDPAHARRVADLEVYVRQSHAERDLADLGDLAPDGTDVL